MQSDFFNSDFISLTMSTFIQMAQARQSGAGGYGAVLKFGAIEKN